MGDSVPHIALGVTPDFSESSLTVSPASCRAFLMLDAIDLIVILPLNMRPDPELHAPVRVNLYLRIRLAADLSLAVQEADVVKAVINNRLCLS